LRVEIFTQEFPNTYLVVLVGFESKGRFALQFLVMKVHLFLLVLGILLIGTDGLAQILTKEDSLSAGLVSSASNTVMSGYGEAVVNYDLRLRTGVADLRRNVLFFGHKFSNKITFFSELELEHAKLEKDAPGELSMEQLFLKFNVNKFNYIVAGLFIPRIGIINENHLPTTYNGNDRPMVEQLVIPSTWREMGIGLYGTSRRIPGLNYSIALMNGLNSSKFSTDSGIREGRGAGAKASASNLALTGALLYYNGNWRVQTDLYIGGTAGLTKREADSLQLNYGAFGSPVATADINFQYITETIGIKGLATAISIPDAEAINRAYANNTSEMMFGAYAEVSYDLLRIFKPSSSHRVILFSRYEWMNLNFKTASNGIANDILRKQFIVSGVSWFPTRGVVIKFDYVHRTTGKPNPDLIVTPFPTSLPFYTTNGFANLGVAYSF
jgi:hypothetical protein